MNDTDAPSYRIPFHYANQHGVLLRCDAEHRWQVFYKSTTPLMAMLELQRYVEATLQYTCLSTDDFSKQLAEVYEGSAQGTYAAMSALEEDMDLDTLVSSMPRSKDLLEADDDAPIIRLINAILTQAIKQGVSDVHFETFEDNLVVRFRIDGVLREVLQPPRVLAPLLSSRLKVMSKLDIAEKRLPQDGRISLSLAGRLIDVRVSTMPTHHGERVVMRLLDKESTPLNLSSLGMLPETLTHMQTIMQRSNGIFLVTGPTGSGKSTTLYAVLTQLNDKSRNILTVEDPVEYDLPGVGQTQVNSRIGMTFVKGLRAILRQDPDIVMVGEIRDLETVQIAIQASLTGHLVLSTLHTNSAIGAITRLRDMGAESYLLASTMVGVAAQRLVRVLCDACKRGRSMTARDARLMQLPLEAQAQVYEPQGCEQCGQEGYIGRTGIYDVVVIDDNIRSMIHDQRPEADMEQMVREVYPSMRQDGWKRVLSGQTSIEEVLRVTNEELT